jgi:acetyl-CoA synthetase
MLILKRRYEYWISVVALHKIGAVVIPATHLLMKKILFTEIMRQTLK